MATWELAEERASQRREWWAGQSSLVRQVRGNSQLTLAEVVNLLKSMVNSSEMNETKK